MTWSRRHRRSSFGIAHDAVVDATNVEALTGLRAAEFLERLERMLDGLGVLFNLTNARNPLLVDDSFVDEQPGPSFGRIRVPRPGREIQVGLRLGF